MHNDVKSLRVLVVEDHDFQRNVAIQALLKAGIDQIETATNGLEAIEVLEKKAPVDIILCDLDMPEMDGISMIQQIATSTPTTSIIISSSQDSSLVRTVEDMAKSHQLHVLGSLPKPLSLEQLKTLINSHFNKAPKRNYPQQELNITQAMLEEAMNKGQFELYFQPKVQLKTGELESAEALVRWCHPDKGIISPGAFIPLMESTRQIDRLTLLLIDQALDQITVWQNQGRAISVAINISPLMLDNSRLPDEILEKTTARNIPPKLLTLEITETGLIENMGVALASLARLKMFGFSLSIDDFGVGYSSMEQLSRIPFSELKIDRSFVHNASQDKTLEAIVDANICLARSLSLKTVAEGIENKADWALLSQLECDLGQGYLIAKPMPANKLNDWENEWKSRQPL